MRDGTVVSTFACRCPTSTDDTSGCRCLWLMRRTEDVDEIVSCITLCAQRQARAAWASAIVRRTRPRHEQRSASIDPRPRFFPRNRAKSRPGGKSAAKTARR